MQENNPKVICKNLAYLCGGLCVAVQAAAMAGTPTFTDVTTASGINVLLTGNEFDDTGGGATWIDIDNDGYSDLFVPAQKEGEASWLYKNNRDGTFTNIAASAGVEITARACTGAIAGDYDNDGFDDLFVTCGRWNAPDPAIEENALLHNNGDGTFTDVTVPAGLNGDGTRNPSYAAAFGDVDGDGDLDLYVRNYSLGGFPTRTCKDNNLYFNNGDGTFTDRAVELNVANAGCTLAVTMTDYDHDGDLDIYVVNDFSPDNPTGNPPPRMYRNDNNGQSFVDVAQNIGLGNIVYGMGVASGDYDNDGDFDYYVTNIGANFLYANQGASFTNLAKQAGVKDAFADLSNPGNPSTGWGTVFFDADNDGYIDLYVTNGAVGFYGGGADQTSNPNRFYGNNGDATFTNLTDIAGLTESGLGRSVLVADYDNDGDMDLLVMNIQSGTTRLFRNDTQNGNHSLTVNLDGTVSNNRGIGAKVRVTSGKGPDSISQIKELHAGESHGSANALNLSFGLGKSAFAAQVVVEWPSGCIQVLSNVGAGSLNITEDCSPPHILTGRVTFNGAGLAGFTLWDINKFPDKVATDAAGFYVLKGYQTGQSVLLNAFASRTGFDPSPASRYLTIGNGDSIGNDFVATLQNGTVSGRFTDSQGEGLADVNIWDILTYPDSIVSTDANGLYVMTGFSANQTVWLNPNGRTGFSMAPGSEIFVHSGGADAAHDFTATLKNDTVSGHFHTPEGIGLPGMKIWDIFTYPGSIVSTDTNGLYVISGIKDGNSVWLNPNGTPGYSINPGSVIFSKTSGAATGFDFTATPN